MLQLTHLVDVAPAGQFNKLDVCSYSCWYLFFTEDVETGDLIIETNAPLLL
jgi:hypothetical protein